MLIFVIQAITTSVFIVLGQFLWKLTVSNSKVMHIDIFTRGGLHKIILSPYIWVGVVLYGVATLAFIYLLSRYNYFQVQSVVVGGSLIFTALIARIVFGEIISAMNYFGIAMIVIGVLLVSK